MTSEHSSRLETDFTLQEMEPLHNWSTFEAILLKQRKSSHGADQGPNCCEELQASFQLKAVPGPSPSVEPILKVHFA